MKRVVWIAAMAAGALFAGNQTSRAQYGGPYPPPYVPPAYTQQQVVPDLVPTVNLQPWSVTQPGQPPTVFPGRPRTYPQGMHTGYANERDIQTGWYVSGMVGAVYLEDQHSEAVNARFRREVDATFDWYANAGAAIGYRLPTRPHDMGQLRLEVDTIYSENKVKTLLFNSVERDTEGEVAAQSFMFNIVLDFIHAGDLVKPYIGGGVGVLRVNEHLEWGTTRFVDTDLVFGFQGMAGVNVQLWENVQWFTEWRYLGGSNPKFNLIGPNGLVEVRSEFNSHSIMSGIRIDLQ